MNDRKFPQALIERRKEGEPPNAEPYGPDSAGARTARRLRDLEALRYLGMEMAARLNEATAMRLSDGNREPFARIQDPTLAFGRISRAIRQIVALEERIEYDRDRRGEDDRVAKAQEFNRDMTEKAERTQKAVRRAVRDAIRTSDPEMEREDLNALLEDTFSDYGDYDDYDRGTPAEIVTRICAELGVVPDLSNWVEDSDRSEAEPTPVGGDDPDTADGKASGPRDPTLFSANAPNVTRLERYDAAATGTGPP